MRRETVELRGRVCRRLDVLYAASVNLEAGDRPGVGQLKRRMGR
jgi:hypothetical protein